MEWYLLIFGIIIIIITIRVALKTKCFCCGGKRMQVIFNDHVGEGVSSPLCKGVQFGGCGKMNKTTV